MQTEAPLLSRPTERVLVVPGLAMPFYPARPSPGVPLTSADQAAAQIAAELDGGRIVQRKLGGDRACVGFADGRMLIQNRHGAWMRLSVNFAGETFGFMGDGTCLDGEVMPGGIFRPFEVLAWGGESLLRAPTYERARAAKLACALAGTRWGYDLPERGRSFAHFVKSCWRDVRVEGVVSKADGPYPVGRSATADTPLWRKLRWC